MGNQKSLGMKDNTDQMVHIIGQVVVALFIVAAIFSVWAIASHFISKGSTKLTNISTTMDESQYTDYDGATVSGTQVISAIKQFGQEQICITVNNGHSTTPYVYADISLSTPSTNMISAAENKVNLSTVYINPNSHYLGKITRDSTDPIHGTIIGLDFTIQAK